MEWNEVKYRFRQVVKEYEGEITEFPQKNSESLLGKC